MNHVANPDISSVFMKYPPFGLRRAPQNGACSGLHFRRVEGPVLTCGERSRTSKVEGLVLPSSRAQAEGSKPRSAGRVEARQSPPERFAQARRADIL